ncbi:TetR family transcriptional regulator [Gordonia sp. VNK21]|uniref:TetR family transcriptional regulator n=1 Tax=Gordonia sp. VNK21 TaxID=3382483 RepID=UPI0038D3B977
MNETVPRRGRGRPPGPPVDPQVRREELLDAAERAIGRSGPDVSLAQVADEAGLTRSAVYAAFADREALVSALARRHSEQVVQRLWEVTRQVEDPREQTRLSVEVLAAWFDENPDLATMLDRHDENRSGRQGRRSFIASSLAEILEDGFRARGLDPAPAATWARGLVGAVSSAVRWWAQTREVGRDELVEHLTALIWSGFDGAGRQSPS